MWANFVDPSGWAAGPELQAAFAKRAAREQARQVFRDVGRSHAYINSVMPPFVKELWGSSGIIVFVAEKCPDMESSVACAALTRMKATTSISSSTLSSKGKIFARSCQMEPVRPRFALLAIKGFAKEGLRKRVTS